MAPYACTRAWLTPAVLLFLFTSTLSGAAEDRAADRAVEAGVAYLEARQGEDGAWRSGVHGVFKDGTALTPHVVRALVEAGHAPAAAERGAAWLAKADPDRLAYPTYAAADAAAFTSDDARRAWLVRVRARQVSDPAAFPSTGGWAYPAGPLDSTVEANLSVTASALCALADAGGAAADDPAMAAGRAFVLRCRAGDGKGGFCFGATDGVDNKPGPGIAYGTATADGVRALLAAGAAQDDPAVRAGVAWLLERFDPAHVPGDFLPARDPMRDANYFYFLEAATDAFARAGVPRDRWAGPIARELVRRQADDGSWRNDVSAGREDDPLVATPLAIRALRRCVAD